MAATASTAIATAGAATATTTSGTPTVVAILPNVVAGQELVATGGGFPAGEPLQVVLFSDPVVLGTTTADALGNYRVTVGIPAGTAPGAHTLVVASLRRPLQASTTIVVTSPVVATPTTRPSAPILVIAGTPLARTGADVVGPARLALALVVLGGLMVGWTWTSGRRTRRDWPRRRFI